MPTKNFLAVLLLISFFVVNLSINTNKCFSWYPLISGTTRNLNDIFFINMNTGWVCGDSILLKTTNGGLNWITQSLPVQITVRSLYFTNENEGFILGDWSSIMESRIYFLKTTNSGYSWSILNYQQILGTSTNAYSKNFIIINDNIILKTLSIFTASNSYGSVLKSTNGGINFYTVLNFGDMTGLTFIDLNTGWTMGSATNSSPVSGVFKIFKTTNQGENWFSVYTDSQPSTSGISGRAIKFFNASTGYILAKDSTTIFMKTTSGGLNWSVSRFNHENNRTMFFSDLNTGWIGGYYSSGSSNIRKTIDGGNAWIQQNVNGSQVVNKLFFLNNNIGWAVCLNGLILKTTNGGTAPIECISKEVPQTFSLKQNYPNPFNNSTKFEIHCPQYANVTVKLYDLLGKEIETIINGYLKPGIYAVTFDAGTLSSGIYFYKLISEKFSEVRSMVLIK